MYIYRERETRGAEAAGDLVEGEHRPRLARRVRQILRGGKPGVCRHYIWYKVLLKLFYQVQSVFYEADIEDRPRLARRLRQILRGAN